MSESVTGLGLVAVADAIRAGEISSREVVAACLARIESAQPRLNCFIAVEAEAAMAAAQRADDALAHRRAIGRLHGVPLAHKDMFYREGRVTTCGSSIRRSFTATTTATVLRRLEGAGAICLGRLNMDEFAAGGTGHNGHFGACGNPWNPANTTGGSSSGSAAAVAGRLVYGSLGSDTGGSVRLPAAMCGVVGLKPTHGRVSRYGTMPRSWSTDTVGPISRTVRDCARIATAIAGADPLDPQCSGRGAPDYEVGLGADLREVRIGVPVDDFFEVVDPELGQLLDDGRAVLRSLGAEIVEVKLHDFEALFALAQIVLKAEAASLHETWINKRPQDYDLAIRSQIEAGLFVPAVRYIDALRLRGPLLADFLRAAFGGADVLFTPVLDRPVPTLEECDPRSAMGAATLMRTLPRCTRPFSYLGVPALAVPCGFTAKRMPAAFQLVAPPFREGLLFRVGHAYQEATDWHATEPPL